MILADCHIHTRTVYALRVICWTVSPLLFVDNHFILRAPENRWLGVLLIQRLFDDQKIWVNAHMLACISSRLFHYVLLLNPHHKKTQKCYINKVVHNRLHCIYSLCLCLCLNKHHNMETYGELEVWLHAFVIWVLYGDERWASRHSCVIFRKWGSGSCRIRW
jgi:hypothetical protein